MKRYAEYTLRHLSGGGYVIRRKNGKDIRSAKTGGEKAQKETRDPRRKMYAVPQRDKRNRVRNNRDALSDYALYLRKMYGKVEKMLMTKEQAYYTLSYGRWVDELPDDFEDTPEGKQFFEALEVAESVLWDKVFGWEE